MKSFGIGPISNYINYLRFLNGFYLCNLDYSSVFSNNFSCIKSACKHVPPSCCVIRIDLWDLLCRALCTVSSAKRSIHGFQLKFKCISLHCADFYCKGHLDHSFSCNSGWFS